MQMLRTKKRPTGVTVSHCSLREVLAEVDQMGDLQRFDRHLEVAHQALDQRTRSSGVSSTPRMTGSVSWSRRS